MTNHNDPQAGQPLAADDPRLSEWIDGRLTAAEAAEVERAVGASPDLSRLVADLRAIKQATRLVPAASPPAGFVEQVMAAIAAGGDANADAAADRVVEREWRAIEAERIAEERAEAEVDKEEAARERPAAETTPRRAWPWLAIGTALAAGLLVAVALNRPEDAPREIARIETQTQGRRLTVEKRNAAPAAGMASPPAAARPRETEELAAATDERLRQPAPRAATAPGRAAAAGQPAAGEVAAREAAAEKVAADRAAVPAAPRSVAAARSVPLPAAPLVVTVGSWTEFDQLLEAHGIDARPLDAQDVNGRDLNSRDLNSRDKDATGWNLELSGPETGLDGFLAAVGADRLEGRLQAGWEQAKQAVETDATALTDKAEAERKAQPIDRRVLVRLVIRQAAGQGQGAGEKPTPADEDGGEP